jgi:hypothetical protein
VTARKHPDDLLKEGRKSLYKPEYCQTAIEYAEAENRAGRFPTIAGFAVSLKTSKQVLHGWKKDYPEFSDALDKFNSIQEDRLTQGGLNGDYHAGFAGLMAKTFFGFVDKTATELSGGVHVTNLTDFK